MKNENKMIKRGEIYYADLRPVVGSEQGGIRPVLIVQNDSGNKFSPTTICIMLTTKKKSNIPTHIEIHKDEKNGLLEDSVVLCEQMRTIDKSRLKDRIGYLDNKILQNVLNAMRVSLCM